MDLAQIKAFIDALASSDLDELEATKDGWTLRLVRRAGPRALGGESHQPQPEPQSVETPSFDDTAPAAAPPEPTICAPLSGIVYLRPSPDQPPFVTVGQTITSGTTVCVIEAMKMFNEVRADRDGVVEAILIESEALVDAGQPLLRLS